MGIYEQMKIPKKYREPLALCCMTWPGAILLFILAAVLFYSRQPGQHVSASILAETITEGGDKIIMIRISPTN
jgi:hypothetical protein